MLMEKWSQFPNVFRRKILLTCLTGGGCAGIATVVFCVSKDRTLLMLGIVILLICIIKSISYWRCAAGEQYHILEGICHVPKSNSPLRLRKIVLTDVSGEEVTLLLDRKSGIKDGCCYRLYFHNSTTPQTGNAKLDAAMRSDALIGLEEIESEQLS